jgi:choice-of-anchor A domain-containing protein
MRTQGIAAIAGLCIALAAPGDVARASALGPAQSFNIFVLGNDTQSNNVAQGSVAVGGNASLTDFVVGSTQTWFSPNTLVVGGNMTLNQVLVTGDVHYGGTQSVSGTTVFGQTTNNQPINFADAATQLIAQSNFLASQTANGTVTSNFGLTLTGTSSSVNVFNVTAAQFASANNFGLSIMIPTGSTAIINVAGTSASLSNFSMTINGTPSESNPMINNILFNFANATSLTDSNVSILGSLLAPNAALQFGYTHIDGTLIGGSLSGNLEAQSYTFEGTLPVNVPEPSSLTVLTVAFLAALVAGRYGTRRRRE